MKKMKWFCLIFIFYIVSGWCRTTESTLDLDNVSLRDALNIIAKFLNINVIMSGDVNPTVSLHLHHFSPDLLIDSLLESNHLQKTVKGNIWFIMPVQSLQKQEDELKLKMKTEESLPLVTRLWHIQYAKAEDIAHLLKDSHNTLLSKKGRLTVDSRTNSICIQDTLTQLHMIDSIIKAADIPVQQVMIETRLASVDMNYECELGIHYDITTQGIVKLMNNRFLDIKLSALETTGHGRLISSPRLFTANQQTASIESGEEIPYQEVTQSGATTVKFKKAVLSLKVTPQVMPHAYVLLKLQVNQDRPSSLVILGMPSINTRQITTNVLVKNGQTIVLGGIYESNIENGYEQVPFLGKIPLIGWLFKIKGERENKRELLIFVTPKIIKDVKQNE